MKKILIIINLCIGLYMNAQTTYTVTMGVTNYIIYNLGDTLKFYTPTTSTYTMYATSVYAIAHGTVINTTFPSSIGYVGKYKIQCADTIINMSNTNGAYWSVFSDFPSPCLSGIVEFRNNDSELNIYPNPSTGNFFINSTNPNDKELYVEVQDLTGRLISKQTLPVSNGIVTLQNILVNGVYMVNIKGADGKVVTKKIIVNN